MSDLNKSNQDHDLEYFWITFKDAIVKYLHSDRDKNLLLEIEATSAQFNEIQLHKSHRGWKNDILTGINAFMTKHINNIAIVTFLSDDYNYLDRLRCNIYRWQKLCSNFMIPVIAELIVIYADYSRKSNPNIEHLYTFLKDHFIKNHSIEDKDVIEFTYSDKFIKLLQISVQYKFPVLFDFIRSKRNINQFVVVKNELMSFRSIENTRAHKLIDMIHINL